MYFHQSRLDSTQLLPFLYVAAGQHPDAVAALAAGWQPGLAAFFMSKRFIAPQ
ncbi:hypothetical protein [Vogesella indigofera]|uniref:hypothetical protein n=1 Tax=Vogesella indigofera TaxID=45465 RepID=UPI00234F9F24|nr:hypothetical protein [Vogesella indigofera]MDC7709279.1 hypothetical protein [Vogesella indigofera]